MTYYLTVTNPSAAPPFAFSTLACPEWSPLEVVTQAASIGFDAIEWRGGADGHAGPQLGPRDRGAVRTAMDDQGLFAVSVTTYSDFVHPDATVRAASVDDLARHGEVAATLGAPVLRAFLGERADDAPFEELVDRAVAGLEAAADRLAGSGVSIAIEPHDDFLASSIVAGLLARIGRADIGAIWDAGNTWSLGERPGTGLEQLRPWLSYVQVKDGTGLLPDWRLTRIGAGEVPLAEALAWLLRAGVSVPVSIEWERPWHPELPPAAEALPEGLAHLRAAFAAAQAQAQEEP
jgi:sugar phosphate isomerase/epimerase